MKEKPGGARVHHALSHLLPSEVPQCTKGLSSPGQRGQAEGDTGTNGAWSVGAVERDLSASA